MFYAYPGITAMFAIKRDVWIVFESVGGWGGGLLRAFPPETPRIWGPQRPQAPCMKKVVSELLKVVALVTVMGITLFRIRSTP
ncbi:hypothetical protein Lepto7375DRAFT_4403 [Leptolyngbya sp. PCC 7375]|nr:hypothetical protein Lepto7375DRAFT_4403 [Leptolyngbya sp. PCC 7375]